MDNIGFLKYLGTMRTIFEAVSAAASSLMEMNAMSVAPTEEEREQLQASFKEIAGHIHQLKEEAQGKIEEYSARKEESAIASEESAQEYTRMQESLIQLERKNAEAKVDLAQKNAEKDEYQRACKKSEADLAELTRRRDEEVRKAGKKKENLKRWFWVPGYGLYLAIDTLANELNNDIGALTRRLEEERGRLSSLAGQYEMISREVAGRSRQIELVRDRMQELSRHMERQNDIVAMYKKQLLYWEDFHMQVSRLESKFRTGENSPDMLYEIVELMEAFEDAAED